MKSTWSQSEAIQLCEIIESLCPRFGCHVALTGGCLYKPGERRDLDLLFYRIRQVKKIDYQGLWEALDSIGFRNLDGFGWRFHGKYEGKSVDMLLPEEIDGEYKKKTEQPLLVFES